ncbi:hypothetical protein MKX08_002231 [Trichoderma sp. CBMAI-0020]|nr:hypothetical protein MKX08_002231 [Trichoderma sp. CBMAI-0020]
MSLTLGPIDDPFFQDLEAAINIMVNVAVKSRVGDNPRWLILDRHPDLGESVSRPTVSPNARLSACPHPTYEVSFDHNCFCFQIKGTMKLFHERFLRPRLEAILSPGYTFSQGDPAKELNSVQIKALENIVTIYNRRVHKSMLWASADQKYEALARFVTDMRRQDIRSSPLNMNFTITVPEGSTNHGNPNLLCTPAKWYDFIIFFFTNYFAHAASIIIEPGQSLASTGLYILLALTLPGTGVARATRAIWRHAATERKNPLKRAAQAGALCMVLKKPRDGPYARLLSLQMQGRERSVETGQTEEKMTETEIQQFTTTAANQKPDDVSDGAAVDKERKEAQGSSEPGVSSTPSSYSHWWDVPGGYRPVPPATAIHGEHWLPENSTYYLAMVPPMASLKLDFDVDKNGVVNEEPNDPPKTIIASSYNLPKMLVSFIQAIWAVTTIYRTRGDQIQQYGYAAFGLTVAPYATMSIKNTLANMLTPDYPSMFLIRTPAMDKAEEDGEGCFKGAIRVELQDVNPVEEMQKDVEEMQRKPGKLETKLQAMGRKWIDRPFEIAYGKGFDGQSNDTPRKLIDQMNLSMDDISFMLTPNEEDSPMIMGIAFFCGLIPLGIVGGLSGFQPRDSSQMERGFAMSWLVVGFFYGLAYGLGNPIVMRYMTIIGKKNLGSTLFLYVVILLSVGVPTIGGMVMVGLMIRNFGICTLIG